MGMITLNIDAPKCCGSCPCFHASIPMYCQAVETSSDKRIVAPYAAGRPDWCPLEYTNPCEDAVSREAVMDLLNEYAYNQTALIEAMKALPSVTPKAQPRVMTPEDFASNPDVDDKHSLPCWWEYRYKDDDHFNGWGIVYASNMKWPDFRPWTSRPDNKTRAETPWEQEV